MPRLKAGTILPDAVEEQQIQQGIAADPNTVDLSNPEQQQLRRVGRPKSTTPKIQVAVRYDADVLAAFKADGPGWQTRMNNALREWLNAHTSFNNIK